MHTTAPRAVAIAAAFIAIASAGAASAQTSRSYILSTATTGGTYYPVGVALATLVKVKLQASEKLDMSAISSAGSGCLTVMNRPPLPPAAQFRDLGYVIWPGRLCAAGC